MRGSWVVVLLALSAGCMWDACRGGTGCSCAGKPANPGGDGGGVGGDGGARDAAACANACGSACCTAAAPCCEVTLDGGTISGRCVANDCGNLCCGGNGSFCCGQSCCGAGSQCVTDSTGGQVCITPCTSSSQCPSGQCCAYSGPDAGPPEGGIPSGLCTASATACPCASGADCQSGCCAPETDSSGEPVGPYVCKPGNAGAYDCCLNGHVCNDPYCCLADGRGNQFCMKTCNNDGDCGASHCHPFATIPFTTTCNGFGLGLSQTACGP